jgi:predicted NBD/HSP70 family sugar kinase
MNTDIGFAANNSRHDLCIGLDIGASKVLGGLFMLDYASLEYRLVESVHATRSKEDNYFELLDTVIDIYSRLVSTNGQLRTKLIPFGVCSPGFYCSDRKEILHASLAKLSGQKLIEDISSRIKAIPVHLNDGNAFALGEALAGSGRGFKSVYGIVFGSGVGGGYVYNGNLVSGRNMLAGEWGQMIISLSAADWERGDFVKTQELLGRLALRKEYLGISREDLELFDILGIDGNKHRAREIIVSVLGAGLANVIFIVDPEAIILGGSLSVVPGFQETACLGLERFLVTKPCKTKILTSKLDAFSAVVGAAIAATHKLSR